MTPQEDTTGGLVGKVAGKVKEAAGEALDRDALAREGRLQQAHVETQEDASRQALGMLITAVQFDIHVADYAPS